MQKLLENSTETPHREKRHRDTEISEITETRGERRRLCGTPETSKTEGTHGTLSWYCRSSLGLAYAVSGGEVVQEVELLGRTCEKP